MPNGKPGDHPYTDIVVHNNDLGEPEIAARVRALHLDGDNRVERLVADLLMFTFPPFGKSLTSFHRQMLLEHLTTIEMFMKAEKA